MGIRELCFGETCFIFRDAVLEDLSSMSNTSKSTRREVGVELYATEPKDIPLGEGKKGRWVWLGGVHWGERWAVERAVPRPSRVIEGREVDYVGFVHTHPVEEEAEMSATDLLGPILEGGQPGERIACVIAAHSNEMLCISPKSRPSRAEVNKLIDMLSEIEKAVPWEMVEKEERAKDEIKKHYYWPRHVCLPQVNEEKGKS